MRTYAVTSLSTPHQLASVAVDLWRAGFLGVDFCRGVLDFQGDALDWLCDLPQGRNGRCTPDGRGGHHMWVGEARYPVRQVA